MFEIMKMIQKLNSKKKINSKLENSQFMNHQFKLIQIHIKIIFNNFDKIFEFRNSKKKCFSIKKIEFSTKIFRILMFESNSIRIEFRKVLKTLLCRENKRFCVKIACLQTFGE